MSGYSISNPTPCLMAWESGRGGLKSLGSCTHITQLINFKQWSHSCAFFITFYFGIGATLSGSNHVLYLLDFNLPRDLLWATDWEKGSRSTSESVPQRSVFPLLLRPLPFHGHLLDVRDAGKLSYASAEPRPQREPSPEKNKLTLSWWHINDTPCKNMNEALYLDT